MAATATHTPLQGDDRAPSRPQPMVGGWHVVEWACELAGTFLQLLLGFGAVALFESSLSPVRQAIGSGAARLLLIGLVFAVLAAAVAVSPLGRRSGAHLNPAVTTGFWARGHTHPHDLLGYSAAQVLGALAAAACFRAAFGAWARTSGFARTVPAPGLSWWAAAAIECAITTGLLLVIFAMVSHPRTARWTPLAVIVWLPILIWIGAPHTGASMNPARTVGPDTVVLDFRALQAYLVGPIAGALLAAGAFSLTRRRTLTPKLFHDARYPSTQKTHLPAKPAAGRTRGADGSARPPDGPVGSRDRQGPPA
jgi:aquaporin Z